MREFLQGSILPDGRFQVCNSSQYQIINFFLNVFLHAICFGKGIIDIYFLTFVFHIFQCIVQHADSRIGLSGHDTSFRHNNRFIFFRRHGGDNGISVQIGLFQVFFFFGFVCRIISEPAVAGAIGLVIRKQSPFIQFFRINLLQLFHSFDVHAHYTHYRSTVNDNLIFQFRTI